MPEKGREFVLKAVSENNVRFIRMWFTDVLGFLKSFAISPAELETALDEGEVITKISFPVPEKAAYMKFPQPASRFALVGVFVAKTGDGVDKYCWGAAGKGTQKLVHLVEFNAGSRPHDFHEDLAHGPDA